MQSAGWLVRHDARDALGSKASWVVQPLSVTFFPIGLPCLLGRRVAEVLDFAEARGLVDRRTAKMPLWPSAVLLMDDR